MIKLIWTHAIATPKPCQDRKVAAIGMLVIGVDSGSQVFTEYRVGNRIARAEWLEPLSFYPVEISVDILSWYQGISIWEVVSYLVSGLCWNQLKTGLIRVVTMAGLGDIVKKAVYLGVGLASYAGEKAGGKLAELQTQAQKLADELVAKGEMTTEEGRRFVEDFIKQAQQPTGQVTTEPQKSEPRRIEIISEDEQKAQPEDRDVEAMRKQVQALQDELRNLKHK